MILDLSASFSLQIPVLLVAHEPIADRGGAIPKADQTSVPPPFDRLVLHRMASLYTD